jgi:hypothetical protein
MDWGQAQNQDQKTPRSRDNVDGKARDTVAKIDFSIQINKITIDPLRSMSSLPYLIIGMKI